MDIIKKKQTYIYRAQTNGYQWGGGAGNKGVGKWEVQTTEYKIGSMTYNVQHGEYSQCFITVHGK